MTLELEFPEQSVQEARGIVEKLRRRTSSRLELAAKIYDGNFLDIGYGYDEIIKTGTPGRYLHEMSKNTDCFTMAGSVVYLVAREARLEPQIWAAIGMKDVKEGEEVGDKAPVTHTFVTCVTGTRAGKKLLQIVDPFMGQFGSAKFDRKRHVIEIYNKKNRVITYRHYGLLEQMSEQEYLKRLEQSRGTGGGRIALATTKGVYTLRGNRVLITFFPQAEELKSSVSLSVASLEKRDSSKNLVFDLITPVSDDGKFDFNSGRLEMYFTSALGWDTHENPQIPLGFPASDALKLWRIWGAVASAAGRRSSITRMNAHRLEYMMRGAGFDDAFEVRKGSEAEEVIRRNHLKQEIVQVQKSQEKSVGEFVGKCKEDELTYMSLLRTAHVVKASDRVRSLENPFGFVFSDEERLNLLRQEFRNYQRLTAHHFRRVIDEMAVRIGLAKGSVYHSERVYRRDFEREMKDAEPFLTLGGLHHFRFPLAFNLIADAELFRRAKGLYGADVHKLEEGVTNYDLGRATQARLFNWLVFACTKKEALWLASFKKGLTRLLDTTNH